MNKETRIKRLYFRSHHRGSKETDLILGSYAEEHLATLDDAALNVFEDFLDESDNDIWDWVCGKYDPENSNYTALMQQLRNRYRLK